MWVFSYVRVHRLRSQHPSTLAGFSWAPPLLQGPKPPTLARLLLAEPNTDSDDSGDEESERNIPLLSQYVASSAQKRRLGGSPAARSPPGAQPSPAVR